MSLQEPNPCQGYPIYSRLALVCSHVTISNDDFFGAECLIEENTSFYGNDLNNGHPKQNDVESCRSHCRSKYSTAKYFEWVGPSSFWSPSSWWVPNTCWCKDSDSGRKTREGSTSGEVICGNDGDHIDEDNTDGEVLLTSNSK